MPHTFELKNTDKEQLEYLLQYYEAKGKEIEALLSIFFYSGFRMGVKECTDKLRKAAA